MSSGMSLCICVFQVGEGGLQLSGMRLCQTHLPLLILFACLQLLLILGICRSWLWGLAQMDVVTVALECARDLLSCIMAV